MINQSTIDNVNRAVAYKSENRMYSRLAELRRNHTHSCEHCDRVNDAEAFDALVPAHITTPENGKWWFRVVCQSSSICEAGADELMRLFK